MPPTTGRNVQLVSTAHCDRTVAGVSTQDSHEARLALRNGCHLNSVTYCLRYPEVTLFDLGNPALPIALCDPQTLTAVHDYLHTHLDQLVRRPIERIHGNGLDTEVCICGPRQHDLEQVKAAITGDLLERFSIVSHARLVPYLARGLHPLRAANQMSANARAIYDTFVREYRTYFHHSFESRIPLLNLQRIYQDHAVWQAIRGLAENKLFILGAGLSLALGYVTATNDSKVFFTEIHRDNDPHVLYRRRPFDGIFPKPTSGITWAVIDKVYTGGSIAIAESALRNMVGSDVRIIRVGLFPKSYAALQHLDYVVFAGRLLRCRDALSNSSPATWTRDLLALSEHLTAHASV